MFKKVLCLWWVIALLGAAAIDGVRIQGSIHNIHPFSLLHDRSGFAKGEYPEKTIMMRALGHGFHKNLHVVTESQSAFCWLVFNFDSNFIIDFDELLRENKFHIAEFKFAGFYDIEVSKHRANTTNLAIRVKSGEEAVFPIHLRYQTVGKNPYRLIDLPTPIIIDEFGIHTSVLECGAKNVRIAATVGLEKHRPLVVFVTFLSVITTFILSVFPIVK
ncbi:hypothetical protein PCE1_003525 [Barthelona sp. PCE]